MNEIIQASLKFDPPLTGGFTLEDFPSTKPGFDLVAIVYVGEVQQSNGYTLPGSGSYVPGPSFSLYRPKYVMRENVESIVKRSNETIESLRAELHAAETSAKENESIIHSERQARKEVDKRLEDIYKVTAEQDKSIKGLRGQNKKAESDLAKIYAAIGGIKMREILGVKTNGADIVEDDVASRLEFVAKKPEQLEFGGQDRPDRDYRH